MRKNRTKNLLLSGMLLAIAVLIAGCGSAQIAQNDSNRAQANKEMIADSSSARTVQNTSNRTLTYEEMLDYLKVDKKERQLVEKITQSNEFQMYVQIDEKYKTFSKEGKDIEKLSKMRDEMRSKLSRTMSIVGLTPNATTAVWMKVGYEQSENDKSGRSSTQVAKVDPKKPVPYEKMLEHLKVSKEEQKMVEQITQSNEFQVYVDMYTEYMELREKMSKEEADKTELGRMRLDLFNSLTSTMDILNFSPNAMAAVWATVSYKRLNKTK